jgi:PST family polysaccharide transporter
MSVKHKTISGFSVLTFSSLFAFVTQFVTTIILARFLSPSNFGIVSALMIIIGYSDIFWQLGIGPALIHKKELSKIDVNTAFSTTMLLSIVTFLIIFLFAPIISDIVRVSDPNYLRVLSSIFIINGVSSISLSTLQRQMNFKIIAIKDMLGALVYSSISIILVLMGFGVWALIIAIISKSLLTSFYILLKSTTRLNLGFNVISFNSMIKFGFGQSISQFLSVTTNEGDYYIVNRYLGNHFLGIYTKAFQLISKPASMLGSVIDQVFYPLISRMQDENEKIIRIFQTSTVLMSIIFFPIGLLLFLLSNDIILLLLGSDWIESIGPFKYLSLAIFYRIAYKISDPIYRAKGKVYTRAILHLIQAVIIVFAAIIGVNWSVSGVSISVSIGLALNYIIISLLASRILYYNPFRMYIKLFIPIVTSIAAYFCSYIFIDLFSIAEYSIINILFKAALTLIIFGGFTYLSFIMAIKKQDRLEMFRVLIDSIRKKEIK